MTSGLCFLFLSSVVYIAYSKSQWILYVLSGMYEKHRKRPKSQVHSVTTYYKVNVPSTQIKR